MTDGMNRRRFLKVLGVTGGGAAVLSGCGIGPEPTEKLIPYLVPPEDQIPGTPTWYASTCRECAAGCGIHVKVREGRAIKIEGNSESPINHGRLCARGQAALQGLYNPDRVTGPHRRNASGHLEPTTWDEGLATLQAKVQETRGQGIAFVTGLESGSFGGYAPGSFNYSPSMMMTHSVVVQRMRAAALDDKTRPQWKTFD